MRLAMIIVASAMARFAGLGCANTLPVYLPAEDRSEGLRVVVTEAGEALGLQVHFTAEQYGAVVLDLVDRTGNVRGHSLLEHGCTRVAWAKAEVEVVAHELGHVLGLEHVDDAGNLMAKAAPADWMLEDWQLDVVGRQAGMLEACRVETE